MYTQASIIAKFHQHVAAGAIRRDWRQLPPDFERDAVHQAFARFIKPYLDKRDIRERINASKAETFAQLREALGLDAGRSPAEIAAFREAFPFCREPETCNGSCQREYACDD